MTSHDTHERRATAAPLTHFGQGLLMGGADVIPGVSGGTVALIVGIYERLVAAIRNVVVTALAWVRRDVAQARETAGTIEWSLVLPLGAGIVTAVGIGSLVIPGLLERYPVQMHAVFFGLIAGSLIVPWRRVDRGGAAPLIAAAVAAVVAAVLVGLPPREVTEPSYALVFACASVAICAMILPGVSGAFLLLVMGVYRETLHAVSTLDVAYIAVFGAGAVVGLAVFSRVLSYLLAHHHAMTMAALVGLMAGSLRALWPWQTETRGLLAPPAEAGPVLTVVALALAGAAAVTLLVRLGDRDDDPVAQSQR